MPTTKKSHRTSIIQALSINEGNEEAVKAELDDEVTVDENELQFQSTLLKTKETPISMHRTQQK